jgi:hypothetical protein
MISQRCPKCYSSRIRRGYRPTPFFVKLLCRFNLLCDTCNWEFVGFAVPGTLSSKSKKKKKKIDNDPVQADISAAEETIAAGPENSKSKSVEHTAGTFF